MNTKRKSVLFGDRDASEALTQDRRKEGVLNAEALQNAILNSAYFSSIATNAKGVIQVFNGGAERMLGYASTDVLNKITPAVISDPEELITRAKALSSELRTLTAAVAESGHYWLLTNQKPK